jgi:putative ubiquitin-RnfH superfamily antitoxin RatB of RatAB toxin-antitoxin module
MEDFDTISIELAYALPNEQIVLSLEVPRGTTLGAVIERSGIRERFPEIRLEKNKVGVYGRLRPLDYSVRPGDRVEIYRPLIADPKKARRARIARLGKQ